MSIILPEVPVFCTDKDKTVTGYLVKATEKSAVVLLEKDSGLRVTFKRKHNTPHYIGSFAGLEFILNVNDIPDGEMGNGF